MLKLFVDRKEIAVLPPMYGMVNKGDVIQFEDKYYEVKHLVHYIPRQYGPDSVKEGHPSCEIHFYCQTFPIL